jgi:carbon starvation protein CstA
MLSDKIWVTRKARIYAERRLQRKAIISQTLITFYSAFLVCLSIWTLLYPSSQLNTFLVFASITVLVASIVLYSHRYSERSLAMRNCYIRLDELYPRAKRS